MRFLALLLLLSVAARAASPSVADRQAQQAQDTPYGNGTMVNIEQSFGAAGRGIRQVFGDEEAATESQKEDYKRGCVAHQQAVMSALAAKKADFRGLEYKRIMLGAGLEHHAVVVFPEGTDWEKTGIVLDGWFHQSAKPKEMVFTIGDWKSNFKTHRMISPTKLED